MSEFVEVVFVGKHPECSFSGLYHVALLATDY